jgi:DDE superfamily endonuclease
VKVMIFAMISAHGASDIFVVEGDPDSPGGGATARSYITMLDEALPECIRNGEEGLIQDNAPIHKAILTREWVAEQGIEVIQLPPYSPDLNVIEHLWFRLKEVTHQLHPELMDLTSGVDTKKEALTNAIFEAWEVVREDRELIDSLVHSIQRRIDAMNQVQGGSTRY